MLRVFPSARRALAIAIVRFALIGGCLSALASSLGLTLPAHAQGAAALRTNASVRHLSAPVAPPCAPPRSLCAGAIKALEEGAFLDFRVGTEPMAIRLLSPFSVIGTKPIDKARCPAKLCAAHVALASLREEFLRQGYYTQSVTLYPGSAVVTLRTERIDRALKVLKGSCRFNLDAACRDFDAWLQEDHKTGEQCGFAQTRVFVAAATAPEFVGLANAAAEAAMPVAAGPESLRSVALDVAHVKVYEVLYVHKICRNAMTLVRNG
jgi:hypothetical protein